MCPSGDDRELRRWPVSWMPWWSWCVGAGKRRKSNAEQFKAASFTLHGSIDSTATTVSLARTAKVTRGIQSDAKAAEWVAACALSKSDTTMRVGESLAYGDAAVNLHQSRIRSTRPGRVCIWVSIRSSGVGRVICLNGEHHPDRANITQFENAMGGRIQCRHSTRLACERPPAVTRLQPRRVRID